MFFFSLPPCSFPSVLDPRPPYSLLFSFIFFFKSLSYVPTLASLAKLDALNCFPEYIGSDSFFFFFSFFPCRELPTNQPTSLQWKFMTESRKEAYPYPLSSSPPCLVQVLVSGGYWNSFVGFTITMTIAISFCLFSFIV